MGHDTHDLGGNITLVGFSELDSAVQDVVRKSVGSFASKFSAHDSSFESLKITLKILHQREKGEVYEVHTHLFDRGHKFNSISIDRNLFVALDDSFKKIVRESEHILGRERS